MSSDRPAPGATPASGHSTDVDCRLYIPAPEGWRAQLKTNWDRLYCFGKNPGEDFHHLLLHGEIYVARGDEVYCLRCARRAGFITSERLNWQRREATGISITPPVPDDSVS